MKMSFLTGIGGLAIVLFVSLASCSKPAPPAKVVITPMQTLVNSDSTLTLFHRMLLQANDAALLADDSITWLLPTNAAFLSAGYTELIIDSLSASAADNLIRYHYLTSRVVPDSGSYLGYASLLGYNVYGMSDSAHHIYFSGNTATGPATTVGKALVYRLNLPMTAPGDSLNVLLEGDSTLSFLSEVFLRTNLYDSLLTSGNFTLLAPNNTAFINAGYDSLGAIDSANINTLLTLVEYHVVTGSYFTNTLMGLNSLSTLQGGTVGVSVLNGALQFKGNSNASAANLVSGNQMAGNTIVVQRIDQVLSP